MNRLERDRFAVMTARLLIGREEAFLPDKKQAQLDLIEHQQLLPMLGWQAKTTPSLDSQLSDDDRKRIERQTYELAAQHRRALEVLEELLRHLASYDPLCFKGLAAAEAWPSATLRIPGDLDLMVDPARHDEGVQVLKSVGWTELPSVHAGHEPKIAAKYGFATMLRHPRWPLALDLHRAPVDCTEPFFVDTASFRAMSRRTTLEGGLTVTVPSPGRHVGFMALHAVRQGYFRWVHFLDLAYWSGQMSHKDNIDIFEFSRTNRILRPVRIAFLAAEQLFKMPLYPSDLGAPEPEEIHAALRRSPSRLAMGRLTGSNSFRRLHAMLDLLPRGCDRWRHIRSLLFPAPELIGRSGRMPHGMHYLIHRTRAIVRLLQSFMRSAKDS